MNRFRKKSDAKPTQVPVQLRTPVSQDSLPELPPASNFRTSLILPDLSRRFTLLRNSSGDPVTLENLKLQFAEQRARGFENQISEEEEDMILETLGRIRAKNSDTNLGTGISSIGSFSEASSASRQSAQSSSSTFNPAITSSPASGRSGKRYSNNLFGSGRFRDYSYVRSVNSQKNVNNRSVQSFAPSESSVTTGTNTSYSESLRPVTPDNAKASSVESTPDRSSLSTVSIEYGLTTALSPQVLKRASLALEEAIKEMEEAEGEDEIVMPRSTPRISSDELIKHDDSQSDVEAGTAISSDRHISLEPEAHRASPILTGRVGTTGTTSPTLRLPGYIPGMPRPMTPRDTSFDDDRSHSTTPRAVSPLSPPPSDHPSNMPMSLVSSILIRETNGALSRNSPRPTSPTSSAPLYLPLSMNGRFTPEDHFRNIDNGTIEFDNPASSTILGRRRPASPLSGPSYQPMAVSSRPGTPSNITWTTSGVSSTNNMRPNGHSRNSSWTDEGSSVSDFLERSQSRARSVRAPDIVESSVVGPGSANSNRYEARSPVNMSSSGYGQTLLLNRAPRASTPTQSRSPTSPTFSERSSGPNSRRSSKQNGLSSHFSFNSQPNILSPLVNSSRSSLESTGSSYHSWDSRKESRIALFEDVDPLQSVWHEISERKKSESGTPPQDEGWDAEETTSRFAGLTKVDFMAVHEKLVNAAIAKTVTPEIKDRSPSLRRRRPSTSQSNYSLNGRETRHASPPPQSTNVSKANALLESVVDSIRSPSLQLDTTPRKESTESTSNEEVSPTTRRNRDLAHILFGDQDRDRQDGPSISLPENEATIEVSRSDSLSPSDVSTNNTFPGSSTEGRSSLPLLSPRTPLTPQSPADNPELAMEVQRKTEAATMALKSPSSSKLPEGISSSGSVRRKISPNQISNPRLVSASTSVDTIPLRSPSINQGQQGPLKIGLRIRRLRGTLRGQKNPIVEEGTPGLSDGSSSPFAQTEAERSPKPDGLSGLYTPEPGKLRSPLLSPPPSGGSLRGFMARFRKQRGADPQQLESRVLPSQPAVRVQPNPPTQSLQTAPRSPSPETAHSLSSLVGNGTDTVKAPSSRHHVSGDALALKQLFDAASNLGLDRAALDDLLTRSPSNASRGPNQSVQSSNDIASANARPVEGERARSPTIPAARPSIDSDSKNSSEQLVKKLSLRKRFDHIRKPRDGASDNTIIRRTVIYPSDSRASTFDLGGLIRKNSQARPSRSASAASFSSRSVHDRAPTPPPSKVRRFSTEASPPVPHLPPSFGSQVESLLSVPHPTPSKTASAYDSLYEMYANESRPGTSSNNQIGGEAEVPTDESGPAVEVIELANGETIWSIVNGLRDDADSAYGGRASFASDYSTREEGVQVFFKEHSRKGSGSSFLSRKRLPQGKHRPETKVFYSSSAQIGRLIENLSQGTESGSFNIKPSGASGSHSHSSSFQSNSDVADVNWTLEERLEHMLGAMTGQ